MKFDARFHIKKSTIPNAGRGVFVKRSLAEGIDIHVEGILVNRNSVTDRCTRYADAYKFRVGSQLLIPLGRAAMINHSSAPNLMKVIKGKKLFLRTLRSIKAREELFYTYSRYAQNRFYGRQFHWARTGKPSS